VKDARPLRPASPLPASALYRRCDPERLPFTTTAELQPLDQPLGQERAMAALRFAIGMRSGGFNLFALGPEGTGKISLILASLLEAASCQPAPDDWVYVHNFTDHHRPAALRLPSGRGPELRRGMEHLLDDLRLAIPAVFEGEEYRTRRQLLEEQFKEHQETAIRGIQEKASSHGIALLRTPVGLALAPMKEGEVLNPDEFKVLPEQQQETFKADMEGLQHELEGRLAELPQAARDQRRKIRELDRETALAAVHHSLAEMKRQWTDLPAVLTYLDAVRDDVVDNLGDFLDREHSHDDGAGTEAEGLGPVARGRKHAFRRFRVNVLLTTSEGGGAPVVYCDHPTQPNLVGRIEHLAQLGALITDFNLIKPGALHQANGGYLVIEARKVLLNPFAWEDLKRALRAREIHIESPGQSWGLFPTVSLEPESIPLDVKVVLIGEPMLYYLLAGHDPDFAELFKVAADFDWQMDRSDEHELGLARLVAGLSRREQLRPFDAAGVARLVEQSSRLVDDAEKLSTHMASLADLIREADHWAGQDGATVAGAAHVQRAIDEQTYRLDRVREHVLDEIVRGTVLIDTQGMAVGQLNGLVVMELGRFAFGRPSRITCRVHLGRGDVVDIEREVELGGPIHSKGVMILSSFLSARFAQDWPLSLSAHLVFEQSYGEVEGDSASSAELYSLLSALADLPLRQDLAVTGSVNQYGQVQAIGGVNEKIEGFFDVCRARGLTGTQGVLVPASNVKHLMLRHDVVEACAEGRFAIYAVETIDQGIALLTGLPAGEPDADGDYPLGSVNRRVAGRLAQFSRKARTYGAEPGERPSRNGRQSE
jgi:predicted ATP-dependent protease